jgi:vancomycin resistance protein YoaR
VSPDTVHLRIAALAAELAATPVVVRTDAGELALTVADLGIALEPDATFDAVRELRTGAAAAADGTAESWIAWSTDPHFTERRYSVDRSSARAVLANATRLGVTATPPSVVVVNGTLAVDLGLPGQVVDADAIVDQVLEGIARSFTRIEVAAELTQSEPLANTPELQQAVNTAHQNYGRGLLVAYGETLHELTIETVAGWLRLDPEAAPPEIAFDQAQIGPYLEEMFAAASAPFTTGAMAVVSGVPTVVASDGSVACCADDVGALVEEALLARIEGPLALPSRPAVSREEQAHLESLGIIELVGTFTTRHPCCQGRVENIQRFAELMRGALVEPGQSLSLNGHVGRRTEEKGFVEGGFIERGVLVDEIGGGVSQFATTIFNALIRAGMTIDEYQTHSLYFSRYPFGLDPTISYPSPDLEFTNPTPYGLLIWPTYTDTSITVELYSTRNVQVTVGEPIEEMREFCRRVRTERTRVFSDGTVDTDTFHARYRPEEGRDCDGSRSVPRQCVDPLLAPAQPPADGEAPEGTAGSAVESEQELVEDGSERADGSIVECPPLECVEQPGERDSELPRYPDDPCLGVDLSTLTPDDEATSGEGDETEPDDTGEADGTGADDDPDDSEGGQSATDDGVAETGEPERS